MPEQAKISGNGRLIAFCSDASNIGAGDTNRLGDVFVRNRMAGTTRLISVGRRR